MEIVSKCKIIETVRDRQTYAFSDNGHQIQEVEMGMRSQSRSCTFCSESEPRGGAAETVCLKTESELEPSKTEGGFRKT